MYIDAGIGKTYLLVDSHSLVSRMTRSATATRILDLAEKMARSGGYNSFSFREIAGGIGVKSASVHYHFPTKEVLGAAIAERYTDRFMQALGPPGGDAPEVMLKRYVAAYRSALETDGLMCLCGIFGAEIANLPEPVAEKTRQFFERNMDWLSAVYRAQGLSRDQCHIRAALIIATLEGAMILARSLGDLSLFEKITSHLE